MVLTAPIQTAGAQRIELVHDLGPGDEIVLTGGGRYLARIIPEIGLEPGRMPEACKGMANGLALVSADAVFDDYGVARVW
jgi:hypothetical protein